MKHPKQAIIRGNETGVMDFLSAFLVRQPSNDTDRRAADR
jgi:hypothetical protein